MSDETIMPFDFPAENPTIIKVIGVGGGGGNAVNHMYKEGIHDVTFVVCNTDNQALAESPVPVKLQLGKEGLGAGNRPERAREAAEESIEDVKGMLNDGCKMVFITAGMGGGTGTGAAPIIAKTAKDMDILTVGIVTIPFLFEGNRKIDQALDGVEKMSQHVDALLVINSSYFQIYRSTPRTFRSIRPSYHIGFLSFPIQSRKIDIKTLVMKYDVRSPDISSKSS